MLIPYNFILKPAYFCAAALSENSSLINMHQMLRADCRIRRTEPMLAILSNRLTGLLKSEVLRINLANYDSNHNADNSHI